MSARLPNLVVLCIDSLRADCFDENPFWQEVGGRPQTPGFDALARESIRFRRAYSTSSWTKPSVPSMLTSRFPAEHGVYEVSKETSWTAALAASLPDEIPTVAETLRAAGYRTLALAHNAQLDASLGLARGFDVFVSDAGSGEQILDRLSSLDPWSGGDGRPCFAYLHLIEPHWPYSRDIARRAKDHAAGRFSFPTYRASQWKALKHDLKHGRVDLTEDETRFLRATYRAAVEESDRAVQRLVSELSANGVLEDTLLVVTADHGEELLDHGLVGHGQSLYDELLRVPLLVRPGANVINARPAPAVTDELASHVDLTPTLLAAASLAPGAARGRDLLTAPAPDRVFAEVKHKRRYLQCVVHGDHKLIRETKFERAPDHANGQGDYNNLQDLFASRPHRTKTRLFDLAHDPGETRDLSHREKDRADALGGMLDAWWQGLERRGSDTRALEEDMIRRLESLGYL